MADMLRAMAVAPELLQGLDLVLVENSPALRRIQDQTLQFSGVKMRWAATFDDSLADRPLLLVANEFFDALPIRQFVKTERGWCERMVTALNGELRFALAPVPLPLALIPADREAAPLGGVYETSPAQGALVEDIARVIAAKGGGALIVDYGYGANAGFGETLQALGGHAFADILAEPGEDDLSAHVDFAALAEAARRGGGVVQGPTSQGEFLAHLGLAERAEQLMQANPGSAQDLYKAVERLMGPEQMGLLFRALAILPPGQPPSPGFGPDSSP
jgi:SAM-dependent MidA family methyltransferase